ncbi:hypothetical protein ACFO9Q_09345 [Paenibacillus sp. GCM10023252]
MEKSKQYRQHREKAPQIESVFAWGRLPKFTPEQTLEPQGA